MTDNTAKSSRLLEIDLIKAFSIIVMIACHVFTLFTTVGANDTLIKRTVYYLGNTSAGLFMFCMGIGMVLTTHCSPAAFTKRGVKLILWGWLLNIFKVIPLSLVLFGFDFGALVREDTLYQIFTTEILPFAGLAFLLTALLKKLRFKPWAILALALVFQIAASTFLAGAFDECPLSVRYITGALTFTGSTLITRYPLLSFFIYPASGMLFGELLMRASDKRKLYLISAACGAAVFIAVFVILRAFGFDITEYFFYDMYHSQPLPVAVSYVGQSAVWAALFYALSFILKENPRCIVRYLSCNITNLYVLQCPFLIGGYLLILEIAGKKLPPAAGIPLTLTVCLLTIGASLLWNKIKKVARKRKQAA